jgi:transmembrane sensor
VDELRRFEQWIESAPENRRQYDLIETVWEHLECLRSHPLVDEDLTKLRPARTRRWGRVLMAAAAVAAATAVGLAFVRLHSSEPQVIVTRADQQGHFVLADGSTIELNSDTNLEIVYSDETRRVRLLSGQALFTVARDERRPFVVGVHDTVVRAIGTRFDIYSKDAQVIVGVSEGTVEVSRESQTQNQARVAPTRLGAGREMAIDTRQSSYAIRSIDIDQVGLWRFGRIHFRGTALVEAVREFNRYAHAPIVIEDHQLDGLEITGFFNADDSQQFLDALTRAYPVEVHTLADATRAIRKKAQ